MSDGDWGERRSSWLVRAVFAALVVLILLAASGGIYGYTKQISYEQAAHNNAQEYARYTSAKAGQACALLPSSQQPKCFADAEGEQDNQAREKRREYDDLVAQQTSALWTNIMGLAAITGMIKHTINRMEPRKKLQMPIALSVYEYDQIMDRFWSKGLCFNKYIGKQLRYCKC